MPTDVLAYINHGRWVVDCPRCNSADLATPGQAVYACGCGFTARMIWPDAPTIAMIEGVLSWRPNAENRNWRHPETVDDLVAENAGRGIV